MSMTEVNSILANNLSGIEGLPYQFMDTVDRRLEGSEIGRKYAEKIVARLPLLFLTPCKPVFMDDNNQSDQKNMLDALFTGKYDDDLLENHGRYYSLEFDYVNYYNYVNTMLASVAYYLGIQDQQITINGERKRISKIDWSTEENDAFTTFFSAKENLVYYLDGMTSISESFNNDTTESSLAGQINGYSDQIKEIRFLLGKDSLAGSMAETAENITTSITSALSGLGATLGGGIVGSIMNNGVDTVLNGGKIIFPKIWGNSSMSRSYSLEIKLRSPDHDSLSIFLNILKPYCKLLALAMPHQPFQDANGYEAPFMCKAFCKGMFSLDYGMITGLSATKGAECCWNDDGLPTQIDISLDIENLYEHLAISSYTEEGNGISNILNGKKNVVANTAYMDFLANMAGLNVAQMEMGRKVKLYYYLSQNQLSTTPSRAFSRFDQFISRKMGQLYNTLS